MRRTLFAILALCSAGAAAQTTMYKCTDAQGRITYSNEACDKQGLKEAGKVADRVTTMPFTEPPKPAARTEPPSRTDKDKAPAIKPVNPLIEKLVK